MHTIMAMVDLQMLSLYDICMSSQQLTSEAMSLPLAERISLAQALWQSIDSSIVDSDENEAMADVWRRDAEMSSGLVTGRSHEDVMRAARRAIGCD